MKKLAKIYLLMNILMTTPDYVLPVKQLLELFQVTQTTNIPMKTTKRKKEKCGGIL